MQVVIVLCMCMIVGLCCVFVCQLILIGQCGRLIGYVSVCSEVVCVIVCVVCVGIVVIVLELVSRYGSVVKCVVDVVMCCLWLSVVSVLLMMLIMLFDDMSRWLCCRNLVSVSVCGVCVWLVGLIRYVQLLVVIVCLLRLFVENFFDVIVRLMLCCSSVLLVMLLWVCWKISWMLVVVCVIVLISVWLSVILKLLDSLIEIVWLMCLLLLVVIVRFLWQWLSVLDRIGFSLFVCGVGVSLWLVCMNSGLVQIMCSCLSVVLIVDCVRLSCSVVWFVLFFLYSVLNIFSRFRFRLVILFVFMLVIVVLI